METGSCRKVLSKDSWLSRSSLSSGTRSYFRHETSFGLLVIHLNLHSFEGNNRIVLDLTAFLFSSRDFKYFQLILLVPQNQEEMKEKEENQKKRKEEDQSSNYYSLRTSEIHLFYNLQVFYWHFLEILWLFIFLVLYSSFPFGINSTFLDLPEVTAHVVSLSFFLWLFLP